MKFLLIFFLVWVVFPIAVATLINLSPLAHVSIEPSCSVRWGNC